MWYVEITVKGNKKATLRVCLGADSNSAPMRALEWLGWVNSNTEGIVTQYRLIDEHNFSDGQTSADEQDKMTLLFRSENGKRFRASLPAAKDNVASPPIACDQDGVAGNFVGMTRSYGR